MTKLDVIGFGALNVDMLFKVDRLAGAEEESFIEDYAEVCGGSAANVMVGLARLGCKVGFIGKVANDREGKLQIDCFKTAGVDTSGIIEAPKGKSGSVIGFVDKKGARALYINSGVNDTIEPRELKWGYVSQTKFLHLTSFVGEKSFRTQKKLLSSLPDEVKISFDPGSLYAQKGFAAIEPLIRNSYVLMPNAVELELLTGEEDYCKGADFMIG
ncbi:MAG: PfkB family carbohydrate kinase, partial [Candidatus Bathyarchaeia archaeon]